MSILDDTEAAIEWLQRIQAVIGELQETCNQLGAEPPDITCHVLWHRLETIDDHIHEILTKLGE